MQIDITGFLEKKSGAFMEELWTLLCDAQTQPAGIPSVFLEKKKEEILRRQQAQQEALAPRTGSKSSDSRPNSRWGRPQSSADRTEEVAGPIAESKQENPIDTPLERETKRESIDESKVQERHNPSVGSRERNRSRDRDREDRSRDRNRERRSRDRSPDGERRRQERDRSRRSPQRRSPEKKGFQFLRQGAQVRESGDGSKSSCSSWLCPCQDAVLSQLK
jgi:serine/arginine repetitive matrix protein 1